MRVIGDVELYSLASQIADPLALGSPHSPSGLKPLYIGRDNENLSRAASLAEAWESGQAFAVPVRPEIVAIDIDLKQVCHLDRLRDILRHRVFVEFASSGMANPNRHFYIYEPDPGVRAGIEAEVEEMVGREPFRSGQNLIRPPGTWHRSLTCRSVPVDGAQFWSFYESVLPSQEEILQRLMSSTHELVSTRAQDRSAHDHKVMWRLVVEGLSDGEIIRLALEGNGPFSEKARERRGDRAALSYLLQSLKKLRPNVVIPGQVFRSREDVDAFLKACVDVVPTIDPCDFGGAYERRVYAAALCLFQEQHTLERPMSVRTLARQAQAATQTVVNKLDELVERGFLRRAPGDQKWKATTYKLETSKIGTYLGTPGGCVTRYVLEQAGTDAAVFRWSFLNESGRSVWNILSDAEELSPKDISGLTGVPVSTVYKALKRLTDMGLVERPRRGRYLRVPGQDLGLLAEQLGADVRAKAQDVLYDQARIGFGWFQLRQLSEQLNIQDLVMDWVPVDSYRFRHWRDGEVLTIDELRENCSRMNTGKAAA